MKNFLTSLGLISVTAIVAWLYISPDFVKPVTLNPPNPPAPIMQIETGVSRFNRNVRTNPQIQTLVNTFGSNAKIVAEPTTNEFVVKAYNIDKKQRDTVKSFVSKALCSSAVSEFKMNFIELQFTDNESVVVNRLNCVCK